MATAHLFESAGRPGHAAPAGEPPRFQVADLLALVRRRLQLILSVATACVALTALVLMLLPTLYSASAVVMLEQRKNNVADASSVLTELPTDAASVQNQIQILTSRDLASQVVDRLGLETDPEFNRPGLLDAFRPGSDLDPEVHHQRIVDAFLSRLSVENEGLSTAISIGFKARSAAEAARIANTVAEVYVQSQLEAKFAATREATNWLESRVRDLSRQVQAADAAVERYKAENDLNDSAGGVPLIEDQISAISTQLVQAKADLAQKQATYGRVDALTKSGHGADISQAVSSPLIIPLRSQEADLIRSEAELATKYGPKHPKLIAVQSQRRDLERKIAEEVTRLAGSLDNDVSVARTQVGSLEASLARAEQQAQTQNLMRVKLTSLEANAASTHSIYDAFLQRLRVIQDQNAIEASDAHVISHAAAPTAPSSPHRTLILALSIPVALLLGLLAALLSEWAAPLLRSEKTATRGVPALAEIPGVAHPRAVDLVLDWPTSPYAQAVRQLTDNICYGATRGGPKVILVTSPQAGEGAATVALSLARVAASQGRRVILVDANLAAPAIAPLAGCRGVGAGLVEVLTGRVPLSRALLRDVRSGALLLSPSQPRGDALRVLKSAQLQKMIAHLRGVSDLLLIHAGPTLASGGLPFLARQVDAVMLVARADVVPRPAVAAAVDMLAAIPAPPIGMVLAA